MKRCGALLVLLLGGCTVGPHYRATTPLAPPPLAPAATGVDPAGALPSHWWSLYRDPALDALVQEALAHNADLRVAAANLERAQAVLRGEDAALLPSTQLTASVDRGRASSVSASGAVVGGGGQDRTLYRAGASLSYEIDLFGRVRRSIEAARADTAEREATRDATRVTVAAATTQAYLNACGLARRIDVAKQSATLVGRSVAITRRQVELGGASQYELSRVGVLLEQTQAQVPQLEGLRAAALSDLAVLTGHPPEPPIAPAAACRALPTLGDALPVGDGAALLRRRPDIRAAERALAGDVARVGVATADLFPTVSLGASAGAVGTSIDRATSRPGVSFGIGPLISWFFPKIVAARSRIDQAGAEARASLARYDGTVLTALGEAQRALTGYDAELRRNAALARAEADSRRAYDLSGVRVRYGAISQLEQIDVQRDLIATEAALAESDASLAQNQVAVFRALGGGWQDAPAIDPKPRAVSGTGGLKLKKPQR